MRTLFDDDEQYIAHLERRELRWQIFGLASAAMAVVGWMLFYLGNAP